MDSPTPPYHHHHHRSDPKSRTKSSSRLSRIVDKPITQREPLRISLDLVSSPTKSISPSALSLRSPPSLPLKDLLLLSPSPLRRSKTRLEMAEEFMEPAGLHHRRCKSRGAQMASPRNSRRSRRRVDLEVREEKDAALLVDEIGKPTRKKRHSGRSKKEKLSLVPFVPPSTSSSPKAEEDNGGNLDRIGELMIDLIMWKDVSKSTLWFGFGFLCFISSCFSTGLNFSIFSAISQLALLYLGVSFFSNSICQRNQTKKKSEAKLKEDDILRLAKLILPALNLATSKTRDIFSGEPSTTLKVIPILLLGAEYGHLITIWRLCALGFFVSFSVPKLYSCYSTQINQRAECFTLRLMDTWNSCIHKKKVVASVVTAFWNLSSIKTRIFTAFIVLVIFRYFRQQVMQQVEDGEAEVREKEQQQALVLKETGEKEQQPALAIAEIAETGEKEKEEEDPKQALVVPD